LAAFFFRVDDIDAAVKKLLASGVKVLKRNAV
jgi:predicted enzyme related to lactoylglutathione lyase